MEPATITIVERDGNVVHIEAAGDFGEIEVIAELRSEGQTIILNEVHVGGPGAGSVGVAKLRELARQFAREQGARRIRVTGGIRTTGANKGKRPRPWEIEVD
jgi:hypothetical protein